MRIAVTVDPNIPVPPVHYGGIERVVAMVVAELVRRGHTVTLFAHPESRLPVPLVPYGSPPHVGAVHRVRELVQLGGALWRRRHDFDVVLSWGRLAALVPILPLRGLAKVQFYARDLVPWSSVRTAVRLAGESIAFSGCSTSVYDQLDAQGGHGGEWHTIFYGVDPRQYTFVPAVPADAPLAFLGRLEPIKGAHEAIEIARRSGRRLVIAGNRVPTSEEYFAREIAPHVDGDRVSYIGPVDDVQKNALLGSAAALLFPIRWREAFGIVQAEAFACGTPVIGYPYGSVPEVVRDGVNGFVCDGVDEAVRAVGRLGEISRAAVRRDCEARFSSTAITDQVEALAEALVRRLHAGAMPSLPAVG